MTDANTFVPTSNANELSKRSASALRTVSDLMEMVIADLPQTKQAALGALLEGGGRVGLELTLDRHGENRISLVGIEREGARLNLATINTIGAKPSTVN